MRLQVLRSIFLILLSASFALAQPRVGLVEIYGAKKSTAEKIRKVVGLQPGDPLPKSKGDLEEQIAEVSGIIRASVTAVCCEDRKAILFVGVLERGTKGYEFRDEPTGTEELPQEIVDAFKEFTEALMDAVRKGEPAEDISSGHSLMQNEAARKTQERFIGLAEQNQAKLEAVIKDSANAEHRAIAAVVLGYLPKKKLVVDTLQLAMRDPDEGVRNNAMRSLTAIAALAEKEPELGIKVQPTWFIEMLGSVVWTDRNKAATALVNMTEKRDAKLLDRIKERAAPDLAEMARWKSLAHALPGYILLGRIAGIEEQRMIDEWSNGQREKIISEALDTAGGKKKK